MPTQLYGAGETKQHRAVDPERLKDHGQIGVKEHTLRSGKCAFLP